MSSGVRIEDDLLLCEFEKFGPALFTPPEPSTFGPQVFDITEENFTVLLASGPFDPETQEHMFHGDNFRVTTEEEIDLTSTDFTSVSGL